MKKPPRRSAGAAGQARSPTWETCREAVRLPAPFVLQYNPLSAYLFHALPRVALAGFFLPQIFGLGRVHYVEFFRLMRGAFVLSLPILPPRQMGGGVACVRWTFSGYHGYLLPRQPAGSRVVPDLQMPFEAQVSVQFRADSALPTASAEA